MGDRPPLSVLRRAWARLSPALRRVRERVAPLARVELSLLVVPFVLLLAVWGFAEVADEVAEGEVRHLDEWALTALRPPDFQGTWLAEAARDLTSLGSTAVLTLLTLSVLGFLALARRWRAALLVAVSVGGGALLSLALKGLFRRPRPNVVEPLQQVLTYSFPSGHAMLSAVTWLTLGALLARLVAPRGQKAYVLCLAAGVAVIVGVSRVAVGVHYPTDVVAGWLAGLAWASLCWGAALIVQARGALRAAEAPQEATAEDRADAEALEEAPALSPRSSAPER